MATESYQHMDPGLDTDIALMLRLAGGEDLALNDLISRWRDRLAAFLLRMVGDHATAMDLTQETFVRLYTSRKTYKPTAAFSTYLFHIATNLARTQARWRKRHPTVPMDDENREIRHEAVDSLPSPDESADLHERADLVNRAITALPEDQREALLLFTVEGMSQAEVAAALGCSPKAVEVRVYRARQLLREALAKAGY
ncbi:MAG TPA: sigma-70 family RNA polymerase sigma factor [Opitutaceae bacterium]|nr:sigma-70 family RNA polymerase sigma factor [Opitutaceae bacterium]